MMRADMKRTVSMIAVPLFLALAGGAAADMLATYGYTAPAGANPVAQGWTLNKNISNIYLGGIDAGSGWRIGDGTGSGYAYYSVLLADMDAVDAAGGWVLSWRASMDSDAYLVGSTGGVGVDNYYLPPNQSRQNNSSVWVENAGQYVYALAFGATAGGDLTISDGTTAHQITSLGGNAGYDVFKDFTLTFDGTSASLLVDSQTFPIAARTGITPATDRAIFGSTSNAGQGSAVFTDVTLQVVPEPSTAGVLGLFGAATLLRRRQGRAIRG